MPSVPPETSVLPSVWTGQEADSRLLASAVISPVPVQHPQMRPFGVRSVPMIIAPCRAATATRGGCAGSGLFVQLGPDALWPISDRATGCDRRSPESGETFGRRFQRGPETFAERVSGPDYLYGWVHAAGSDCQSGLRSAATRTIFARTYRSSDLSVYAPSVPATVAKTTPILSE